MNRNKEYRLKRKSLRKDYIIQDKNFTIKTLYYRNETKRNKIEQLQQENKQLKEELQKADSITQSCILEGKEESTINFRQCLNKLTLYKEVIEEVREAIKHYCSYRTNEGFLEHCMNQLLQILDKGVKGE